MLLKSLLAVIFSRAFSMLTILRFSENSVMSRSPIEERIPHARDSNCRGRLTLSVRIPSAKMWT